MAKNEKFNRNLQQVKDTVVSVSAVEQENLIPEFPVKIDLSFDDKPKVKKFNFKLVVRNPFNEYKKGQRIFNDEEIQSIIDKGKLPHCCKVSN